MPNEADTCRLYVLPKLRAAGWDSDPHRMNEQVTFTDGRVIVTGRTARLKAERKDFFDQYTPQARAILDELLDKYAEHGTAQFVMPDVLELSPINQHGNVMGISRQFGGEIRLAEAVTLLERRPSLWTF